MTDRRIRNAGESREVALRRRFRTEETEVPVGGAAVSLLHPANADELISEADFVVDERLPYWADIWPSSTVLAAVVGGMAGAGRTLLELGCGLGLVATAAARAGFAVTATDYYDDALLFAAVNARRNGGGEIVTRHVDWRRFPDDLRAFDLVVASDVLYERPYAELVARALAATIAPGGRGLVADPGRIAAGAFVEACTGLGLAAVRTGRHPWSSGPIQQTIDLLEVTRARG